MEITKEEFKRQLENYRRIKIIGDLSLQSEGRLEILEKYKNLILFGVGSSKPIKEEIDFIVYKGKKFVHKTDLETLIDNGTYVEVS